MDWRRFWQFYDDVLDVIIWAWDAVMLYFCALFVIPLTMAAITGILYFGKPPAAVSAPGGVLETAFFYVVAGAPFWLAIAGYAKFTGGARAGWLHSWIERVFWPIVYTLCALLLIFAALRAVL